jgi:pimeloyl-ACP methyl ester carboxylesterase
METTMSEIKTILANDVEYAYLEAGEGPLALCVHGWPDTAHTWRHLMPRLADAGYHAVAPFMRGYGPTALPGDGAYQVGALVADANALHDVLGGAGDAVIIGSDMGALATYGALGHSPHRWAKAVTMAAAPHKVLSEVFLDYDMMKRIYYIFMLQTSIAEQVLERDPFGWLTSIWNDFSPGFDATDDIEHLKVSLADRDHLRAATIGVFQARIRPELHLSKYAAEQEAGDADFERPLLYLHGRQDGVFPARLAETAASALGRRGRQVFVEDAGHFLQLEQPQVVNDIVIDWLGS